MATRLDIVNGEVNLKRSRIKALLELRPDKNFSADELKELTGLNDDLAKLCPEQESLQNVEKMLKDTEDYYEKHNPGKKGEKTGGAYAFELPNGHKIELKNERGEYKSETQIQADILEGIGKSFGRDADEYNGGLGSVKTAKDLARGFVESDGFKKFSAVTKRSPEVEIEAKTLLDTTGFPVASVRSNLVLGFPQRRLVVADLLPNGNISQPRFLYLEETVNTNNAAFVAEGGQKPESALEFEEKSADVRKIATILPMTDELFQDAPAMFTYVQGRLTLFLQLAEEAALIGGDGVSPNIEGILHNSGIQVQAKGADTIADCVYKAITKVEVNSFLAASGIILNPFDWQTIRLSKDANGNYLFGSPMAGDTERLFGYPIVRTTAMTVGTGLVGAFDSAAMIFRRTGIAFAVSTEHSDFFIKNKLMMRVEERLAFPIFRPLGFCELTGLNT